MKKLISLLLLGAIIAASVPFASAAADGIFKQITLQYTGINTARAENTLIIYRDRPSTGTNTWGYEVVCDESGIIIRVGGNDNIVPSGGFVLSAIGDKKQPLIDAAKVGMSVTINEDSKTVVMGFTREGIGKKYELQYNEIMYRLLHDCEYELYDYDEAAAKANVEMLDKLRNEAVEAVEAGDDKLFTEKDREFKTLAEETRLLLIPGSVVEARTIWLRIPANKNTKAVQNTVKQISELGFNSVCIEVMFDNSMIIPMPEDSLFEQNPAFGGVDMLKLYTDEFHKYGIEVHAWMSCYRVGYEGTSNTRLSVGMKKPEWRCISATGKDKVSNEYGDAFFLNPALPEVKELLLNTYRYILENYDIDGFQLDYVRYPEVKGEVFGYDDYTKSEFLKDSGLDSVPVASNRSNAGNWKKWVEFRAAYVTDLVRSVRELIKEIRPDVWFSCDVAPDSLSVLPGTTCQDTVTWINEGLVDIIYPMAYGTTDAVVKWTNQAITLCKDNVYTVTGLRDNGPSDYLDQIVACRAFGAAGSAFFSYSQYIAGEYKGFIEKYAFDSPAVNPTSGSKKTILAALAQFEKSISKYSALFPSIGKEENEKILKRVSDFKDGFNGKSVSEYKTEIGNLCSELQEYGNKAAEDYLKTLISDSLYQNVDEETLYQGGVLRASLEAARIIRCAVKLNKDDEKAAYAESHPPVSEDSAIDPSAAPSEASGFADPEKSGEASESDEKDVGVVNKIFQVLFIVIMTTGLLGLPLYYYLDKRRRRLKKEASGEIVPDEDEIAESDEEAGGEDCGDHSEEKDQLNEKHT